MTRPGKTDATGPIRGLPNAGEVVHAIIREAQTVLSSLPQRVHGT